MELLGAITFAFGVAAELRRDSVTAHAAEYYSQMELHSNGTSSRNSRSENTDYYARQGDEGNPSLYVSPGQSRARGPVHGFQGAYVPLLRLWNILRRVDLCI
jgi:hypothetical protein